MRRNDLIGYKCFRICTCMLLLIFSQAISAQAPVKFYSIKNGKMFITLGRNLPFSSLDSFITKYNLNDLSLPYFIKTGSADSLYKLGWKVDISNNEIYVISKPLFSIDNITNPAEKIIFTQKENPEPLFSNDEQVHFGYNRFENKSLFAVDDSVVTFFLRGNSNAKEAMLAGSFNDWQPDALPMTKTDSGWIAPVKLNAGKYWYKFIVDGKWTIDRDNPNKENDGMGNDNSVYYKTNYTFNLGGNTNAKRVYLAGNFNRWKEKDLLMQRTDNGWTLPVYLPEGTYTYRFIVDGKWIVDPGNTDRLPNEYDDYNSVIRIGKPYIFKLEGYTDARKVVLLGSFNDWKDNELFMTKTETGWILPYTLGPGNYSYQLKIDGDIATDSLTGNNMVLVIAPNFTFRLKGYDNAKKVCLSGDLNNWEPNSFRMRREGDEWIFQAHLNKGKQRYKFIVDGQWILDPANKLWEQNEYNTGNSVLWFNGEQ